MRPRIGFLTEGDSTWPEWDRFITVDGKNAFHIGNVCETCEFFFEQLGDASSKISPDGLSARLGLGLTEIDKQVVQKVVAELPAGRYSALLLKCVPRLVFPSNSGDYFCEEQVALWGIDEFLGVPHNSKTEYYRTASMKMSNQRCLFEFIVPMFPTNHLHTDAISSYISDLSQGVLPTALAVSILDVKHPSSWKGDPEVIEHWCLSHYVLDGHHKLYAASELGKPVSILSFLAIEKGVATRDDVAEVIKVLANGNC